MTTILYISFELCHWSFYRENKAKKQNRKGIKLCRDKYIKPYLVKETELAYFKLVEK